MLLKKLNKEYRKLISPPLNLAPQKSKFGIVYTLYSDRFNSIEVGFAENDKILRNKPVSYTHLTLPTTFGV